MDNFWIHDDNLIVTINAGKTYLKNQKHQHFLADLKMKAWHFVGGWEGSQKWLAFETSCGKKKTHVFHWDNNLGPQQFTSVDRWFLKIWKLAGRFMREWVYSYANTLLLVFSFWMVGYCINIYTYLYGTIIVRWREGRRFLGCWKKMEWKKALLHCLC